MFLVELYEFFVDLGYYLLVVYDTQHFLPFSGISFHFNNGIFYCIEAFQLMNVITFIFAFVSLAVGIESQRLSWKPTS